MTTPKAKREKKIGRVECRIYWPDGCVSEQKTIRNLSVEEFKEHLREYVNRFEGYLSRGLKHQD